MVGYLVYSLHAKSLWIRGITLFAYGLMNISPSCILTSGIGKLALTARANAYCSHNYKFCPNTFLSEILMSNEDCCSKLFYHFN